MNPQISEVEFKPLAMVSPQRMVRPSSGPAFTPTHQQSPVLLRQSTSFPGQLPAGSQYVMIPTSKSMSSANRSHLPRSPLQMAPAQRTATPISTTASAQDQFFQVQGNIMIRQPQQQQVLNAERVVVKTEAPELDNEDVPMQTQVITARMPNNAGQAAILSAVGDQLHAAQGNWPCFSKSVILVMPVVQPVLFSNSSSEQSRQV